MNANTIFVAAWVGLAAGAAGAQAPVKVHALVELSGPGATAGTNFRNGVQMAVNEINAAGGLLGRRIELVASDTQSQPAVAKALTTKAIDDGTYVIMGPVFSGSIMVSMKESERAEVTNFTGGEAAGITQQNNPYVFRTSFSQVTAMPKVGAYFANELKARSVAVIFVNNDFGKGGRDVVVKEFAARGIKVVADISTDPGQVDFSAPVLKAKQAGADALFVYLNEDESGRILRELRKQGVDKPIIGETTLMGQKVIELAGDAANGVRGHVGLTIDAPNPLIQEYSRKYEAAFKAKSDHNGIKGYTGMYVVKAATEKAGKVGSKDLANALRNACFSARQTPGLLMDVCFDDKGDIDRESYMVEVKGGRQIVVSTLPALKAK